MNKTILKVASWFVLTLTIIVALAFLVLVFYIFYYIKDATTWKLILIDGAVIFIGVLVFAAGLGVFEILRNYAAMEDKIQKLKDNMQYMAEIKEENKRKLNMAQKIVGQ